MNRLRDETIAQPASRQRDEEAQLKRLAEYLEDCRQQHKTTTYLEAANAIAVNPPQRIQQVASLLEALMEHDQNNAQPLRAALVVSRAGTDLPAEGFFLKAQALGLMQSVTAEEFHQQCLNHLFGGPAFSREKK